MHLYRNSLPQLAGDLFITDAGLETDLIFNHGIEIREFASHTLLADSAGRHALARYMRDFLDLAKTENAGFILDVGVWKAHIHWADDLGASVEELRQANRDAVSFAADLRDEYNGNKGPIVLNAVVGPIGDAYKPEQAITADEAEQYHRVQIGWLAETDVDMISAMTFTNAPEAIGIVKASAAAGIPIVVSFTVETDGRLPSGQSLRDAITEVDEATSSSAAYFMINCAHPDHFGEIFDGGDWQRRIRGLRCNASRLSHEELDNCDTLDDGNPHEFGASYRRFVDAMPWINVVGGCCGSDFRHVSQIVANFREAA